MGSMHSTSGSQESRHPAKSLPIALLPGIALLGLACAAPGEPTAARPDSSQAGSSTTDPEAAPGAAAGNIPQAAPHAAARVVQTGDGRFSLQVSLPPEGIPFNEPFELEVLVTPNADGPLPDGLRLVVTGWMPAHGHGLSLHPRSDVRGPGAFHVRGLVFHMTGDWEIRFDIMADREVSRGVLALVLQ